MRTNDRQRLKKLLENDKSELTEASRAAALAEFKRVANEYFETNGGFLLTTQQGRQGTEVILTFRIVRAKNFTTLR